MSLIPNPPFIYQIIKNAIQILLKTTGKDSGGILHNEEKKR